MEKPQPPDVHTPTCRPVSRRPYGIAVLLAVLLAVLGSGSASADEEVPGKPVDRTGEDTAAQPGNEALEEKSETAQQRIWNKYVKGFLFETEDGRFSLNLAAAIQLRYTYVGYDDALRGNEEDYSNFYMRRARLWVMGHAYDRRITYLLHIQLEPNSDVNTHDIWLKYRFHDLLQLGMGRNKIAYGLEFLNSGFGLAMVERSVMYGETDIDAGGGRSLYPGGGTERFGLHAEADTGFATGGLCLYRSQGIQLEGQRGGGETPFFEYQAGIWQGRRTRGTSNRADNHLFAVRAGYYPFGRIGWLLQGDGEHSRHYRLGLLVSAYAQSSDRGGGFDERGYNIAVMNRFRGFSADLEWGAELFDYDRFADDFTRAGWRVQVGYFLRPGRLELVGRLATIERLQDPTLQKALDSGLGVAEIRHGDDWIIGLERSINELSLGLNIFLNSWHRHKVQLDVSRLTRTFAADPAASVSRADDQEDLRFRAMVQLKI